MLVDKNLKLLEPMRGKRYSRNGCMRKISTPADAKKQTEHALRMVRRNLFAERPSGPFPRFR